MGASRASNATSAYCLTGRPNWSAIAWSSMPLPAEQLFDSRKFLTSPFCMNITLMSCPPMSQITSTDGNHRLADIMCATVSTMLASAPSERSSTSPA